MKPGKIGKALGVVVAGASLLGGALVGAPLEESHVGKEAKWLAHVNMDALRNSSLGSFLTERFKRELSQRNESTLSVDVDRVLAEIRSITAYGSRMGEEAGSDGVLVFRTGSQLPALIDGFLAHEALMKEEDIGFQELEDKPFRTILFDSELYLAYPRDGLIMASKRFEEIESAYAVLEGRAPHLAADNDLLLNNDDSFFLIATAAGFDKLDHMPPQARILQKTTGGQISIGEEKGELRANLMLSTSGSDVSQKVYHILRGFVALASFTTVEDESMADLVDRITLGQGPRHVSVDFRYPAEALLRLMGQVMDRDGPEPADTSPEPQTRYDSQHHPAAPLDFRPGLGPLFASLSCNE